MAQTVHITLTDDLDGSAATETVAFSLDGASYELDLNNRNAAAFRRTFERYVAAGRKVGGRTSRRRARNVGTEVDAKAVRAWAASHKIEVSARGRIPADVVEKYRSAGN